MNSDTSYNDIMAHIIEVIENPEIVKVTYKHGVTMEERLNVVHEVCLDFFIATRLKLIIDVRLASQEMSPVEQTIFGKYLASREELNKVKVAIISNQAQNINQVITQESLALGHQIKHFNIEQQAVSWLKGIQQP
ncbi:MAG: hypothetical protein OQK09_07440 [Colwellia sp.]|nr:hypothetical protein [Colwellia sp.]MCW8866155.1 hypothetical protein [Colwellia sp.]MCW9081332.1 hypothetical protein [Colwellia sp.]